MHMASSLKKALIKRRKKPSEEIQLRFLKRLHRLLSRGYPLLEALEVMTWDKELSELATNFIEQLKAGRPLDEVFDQNYFHHSIPSFLYFTRASSNLTESILKCSEMFNYRMTNNKKFNQVLRYPLILLFFFSLTIFFINQQVLPSFESLFQSSSQAKKTVSTLILIINTLQYIFVVLAFTVSTCLVTWLLFKKNIPIDKQLKVLNKLPIYRNFLKLQTSFQFASHFSSLLKAGLSLKQILSELSKQTRLPVINYYADLITLDLNRGFHLSTLLSEFPFIERQLSHIFQKNNDVQSLEKDLNVYSEVLMEEIQRKIISTITLIQPIFYIIIAIFIIFIYISLMWPMFQLINSL